MRSRKSRIITSITVWCLVILILLIFDFPIINTIITSLKSNADISTSPPPWIFNPISDHYKNVLYAAGFPFPRFFRNSLYVSLFATLLTLALCFPAAYSIARFGTGGKTLLPFVVSLRLLPPIMFVIPLYILLGKTGLVDTLSGLVLVNTLVNVPLALLVLVSFIQDLPREIEEAAMIDGCSIWNMIFLIVLPLTLPGISAVAMLTFIWSWNEYLFALILTINRATTVTVGASLFVTAWGIKWGDIAAAISLSIIPILIFTVWVQKYLVRGLTLGAIK